MGTPGPNPRITLEDVLDLLDQREDQAEPVTASEVADELDCSRRTALNKLHELDEAGTLRSKKVGGRSRVYWIPIRDK